VPAAHPVARAYISSGREEGKRERGRREEDGGEALRS